MFVVLFVSAATLFLLIEFAREYIRLRLIPHLPHSGKVHVTGQPPVSILIPARNEAHNIGRCLDGIFAQQYTTYEVVVVDDGSTDATGNILAQYATHHPNLRILQGAPLPAGWTGKCFACQQAAQAAGGEWLVFLDADTAPQPALLGALLSHAQRHELDMLSILPFQELHTFWERVVVPTFLAQIHAIFPVERVNAPDAHTDEIFALGQCMLVRRHAYEQIGGHGAVCHTVLEDVRLAQTLHAAGFHVGVAEGTRELRVRMYNSGREVLEGLTKNAREGYRSGGRRSLWTGVRQIVLAFGPLDLLVWGVLLLVNDGGTLAWAVMFHASLAVLVAVCFWAWLLRRWYGIPATYALLWPLGVACYSTIALLSIWRVRSGRGVIWKGRTYVGK